jgi:RNA polymerase sigma-70 factor (ECF subfamily)
MDAAEGSDRTDSRQDVTRRLLASRSEILSFILALVRDFDLAEEIFQEVALVICERHADFKAGTDFRAWTRQIARNKIFQAHRGLRARVLLSPEAIEALDAAAGVEIPDRRQHQLSALRKCMEALGARARQILAWRYDEGQDCARIAGQTGRSVAAVHKILSRLRGRLADCVRLRLADPRDEGAEP